MTALELELLTAAVDGDLTPDRALAFNHLMKAKSEAAELFRALEVDARKLRAAIPRPIPASQVTAVLARIRPMARPRRAASARRSIPSPRRSASEMPNYPGKRRSISPSI